MTVSRAGGLRAALSWAALMLAAAGPACAPAARADDALYRALGERAGIAALMADFVTRLKTDIRVAPFFREVAHKHLTQQLGDQVCQLAGGPCSYEGVPMAESHAKLAITRADFNATVEILQEAMDARSIPIGTQNALLARLAPLHREIVTR